MLCSLLQNQPPAVPDSGGTSLYRRETPLTLMALCATRDHESSLSRLRGRVGVGAQRRAGPSPLGPVTPGILPSALRARLRRFEPLPADLSASGRGEKYVTFTLTGMAPGHPRRFPEPNHLRHH